MARVWRAIRSQKESGVTTGDNVEQSLAMCTNLAPVIGYDLAAEIAKESFKTGKTVREVALARKVLPEEELAKVMDARGMTGGNDE